MQLYLGLQMFVEAWKIKYLMGVSRVTAQMSDNVNV